MRRKSRQEAERKRALGSLAPKGGITGSKDIVCFLVGGIVGGVWFGSVLVGCLSGGFTVARGG